MASSSSDAAHPPGVILIPIAGTDEHVEFDVSELPEDTDELIEMLQNELAPPKLWFEFAVEYYRQGRFKSFEAMLQPLLELHAQRNEMGESELLVTFTHPREGDNPGQMLPPLLSEKEAKDQLVQIMNALAAYNTTLGAIRAALWQPRRGRGPPPNTPCHPPGPTTPSPAFPPTREYIANSMKTGPRGRVWNIRWRKVHTKTQQIQT